MGIGVLAFVVGCRLVRPMADFYAERCYPVIAKGLSWCASLFSFSLEELVVLGFVGVIIFVLVRAVRKREGFLRWLGKSARVVMWLVVWFYVGWGINYFRTPLLDRMGVQRETYDGEDLSRFLEVYTEALNGAVEEAVSQELECCPGATLEEAVKDYYASVLPGAGYAGLFGWQHVKRPLLNKLYSSVGVLGFMGPFFCEAQVNLELLEIQRPFTVAHELAHLTGVTSEAEANYWAFLFCRQSGCPAVRYSGWLGLLRYVSASAREVLSEEEYAAWEAGLAERVKADCAAIDEHWAARRVGLVADAQHCLMDSYLKSNGLSAGAGDYMGVVELLMTLEGGE